MSPSATTAAARYLVHGLRVSYFTRKVTGFLDHADWLWSLVPSLGINQTALEAGWNGGIPVVATPEGDLIWDSTSVLMHLDTRIAPGRSVCPDDPTLAFLDALLDDFSDEWFYRHAVGSRWLYDENRASGSLDIAREGRAELHAPLDLTREFVAEAMTACLPRLGMTPENVDAWISESLRPWQRVFGAHVANHGFLLGGRPAVSDFAFFGGNAAHFTNDPVCLRWSEEVPGLMAHTAALSVPGSHPGGRWFEAGGDALAVGDLPDTLMAVLAETGRHYLPWVAEATVKGSAVVHFEGGASAEIATTGFLNEARGVLLGRYVAARSEALDGVLEEAGILKWFADHTSEARTVPDPFVLPRPEDNRPYRAGV